MLQRISIVLESCLAYRHGLARSKVRLLDVVSEGLLSFCEMVLQSLNFSIFLIMIDGAHSCLKYFGAGIVRGIDIEKGVLYVITPLDLDELQQVDVFLQGRIEIPVALLQVHSFNRLTVLYYLQQPQIFIRTKVFGFFFTSDPSLYFSVPLSKRYLYRRHGLCCHGKR
jgi:hypothetical protein